MVYMDLDSDVGESFGHWTLGDDTAIFRSVSSANVACGVHAGDPTVIRRTCREAVAAGVTIGAHVGYRDLAGFGRRFVVRYVKPHGGLYNAIVSHTAQARAVVYAVKSVDPDLPILGLPGSDVLRPADGHRLRRPHRGRLHPENRCRQHLRPWRFPQGRSHGCRSEGCAFRRRHRHQGVRLTASPHPVTAPRSHRLQLAAHTPISMQAAPPHT
ncbi:hypothetical protein ABIB45_003794 [Arthrobacter sp. UYCo732]